MNYDDELTQEEQTASYLQQNPDVESGLWVEWVVVVCGWDKIDPPTALEWTALKANFHHGKAPVASVAELKAMRAKAFVIYDAPRRTGRITLYDAYNKITRLEGEAKVLRILLGKCVDVIDTIPGESDDECRRLLRLKDACIQAMTVVL